VRRPQHEVNPAASSHSQCESRAAHVTAKATSTSSKSGKTTRVSPGHGEQHALNGSVRNSRDPSAQPSSGQGRPFASLGAAAAEPAGLDAVTLDLEGDAQSSRLATK
jgi:hypothetical protein